MKTIDNHSLFELVGQRQYVFHSAVHAQIKSMWYNKCDCYDGCWQL